jgi:hypothetical protein
MEERRMQELGWCEMARQFAAPSQLPQAKAMPKMLHRLTAQSTAASCALGSRQDQRPKEQLTDRHHLVGKSCRDHETIMKG